MDTSIVRGVLADALSEMAFHEGACPIYRFHLKDAESGGVDVFNWDVKTGISTDAIGEPTCVIEMELQSALLILSGQATIEQMLDSGKVRVGGLVDDVVALGSLFAPPTARFVESAPPVPTQRKVRLAGIAREAMIKEVGHVPPRLDEMLRLWIGHRMDKCRLDHWTKTALPDLEVTPWEDPAPLGIDGIFDAVFPQLRAEAAELAEDRVHAPHYGVAPSQPDEPIRGRPQGWRNWTFIEDFELRPGHDAKFPVANSLLAKLAEKVTICHASFLIMEPGVSLSVHSDAAGWALSYNYGLVVPENCHITVARERRYHKERASLVFNDSFIHKAANESDKTRVVFQIVLANPRLSLEERRCLRSVSNTLPKGSLVYAIQQD